MKQWPFLVVMALLSGCLIESEKTPKGALRSLLQASERGNCKKAWSHLSSDRQEKMQAEFDKLKARGKATSLEELYCKPSPLNNFTSMLTTTISGEGEDLVSVESKDGTVWMVTCLKDGASYKVHRLAPK